jgi:hypothetical protein
MLRVVLDTSSLVSTVIFAMDVPAHTKPAKEL